MNGSKMAFMRITRTKFIFITLLCLVVYNEWISLYLKVQTWPKLLHQQNADTLVILVVADPQILSVQTEPSYPFSYVAVWDANRFVSRTFQFTLHYSQPDIIVFLGDLINDGSVSDHNQFIEHVSIFKKLFPSHSAKQVLYLPGDNDIGGEGLDFTSKGKVQRFYTAFNSSNPVKHKFVQLYHLNAIPGARESLPSLNIGSANLNNDTFRLIFSHYPLTSGASKRNIEDINKVRPAVIFSAHDHISYQLISKKDNPKASIFKPFQTEGEILEINLKNEELHEISVPTCSYRMGKADYGYGLAQLNKSGILTYTVLWLPSRFTQIWCYFLGLVICLSLLIYPVILHVAMKYSNTHSSTTTLSSVTKHHRV